MFRHCLVLAILITTSPAYAQQSVRQFLTNATVISNSDGDTLTVKINHTRQRVRLACIDAPEKSQAGGKESSFRLQQLLPPNLQVQLRIADTDRYGRTVAEVFSNSQSINLQIVAEGQAVVYRQYVKKACQDNKQQYFDAKKQAKRQNLGFWKYSPLCYPSEFRRKKCS